METFRLYMVYEMRFFLRKTGLTLSRDVCIKRITDGGEPQVSSNVFDLDLQSLEFSMAPFLTSFRSGVILPNGDLTYVDDIHALLKSGLGTIRAGRLSEETRDYMEYLDSTGGIIIPVEEDTVGDKHAILWGRS